MFESVDEVLNVVFVGADVTSVVDVKVELEFLVVVVVVDTVLVAVVTM